jgi:NAD(P)-dependent dehydrogenase (short-subunit alcohol dehydrogenase family)
MEKIVISGGSSGIGQALVKKLVSLGHTVFTFARSEEKLRRLHSETEHYPGSLHSVVFDLETGDFASLAKEIHDTLGQVTRLVNNAGWLVNKPFAELTKEEVERSFRINVISVFSLAKHLLPLMPASAHMVNITSMGGFQGSAKFAGLSAYSAAKGALSVLTESLAAEFSEQDIRVNALALGAVQTEMLAAAFPDYRAPVTPEQMADFIAEFTLNGHHYFNGKILPVSLSTP